MESENYKKPQRESEEKLLNDKEFPEMLDIALPPSEIKEITEQTKNDIKKQETTEQEKQHKLLEGSYNNPATKEKEESDFNEEKNKEESARATDGTEIGRKVFGFMGDAGMGALRFGARKTKDTGMGVLEYGFNALFRPWKNKEGKTIYFPGQKKEKPKE